MKQVIVLLVFLLLPAANIYDCFAQQNTFIEDTSTVELRESSKEIIQKFRSSKDFIYDQAKDPVGFWEIISAWITGILKNLFASKTFYYATKYLGYIIIVIAVILVVYVLHKSKLQGVLYSSEETAKLVFKEIEEDIHAIDFDTIINNAIINNEFRIAVRYYYLKTLKLLSDNNLIEWKINKTNYQYIREIKENDVKTSFSELTNIFEWIWYGETAIEYTLFESAQKYFIKFNEYVRVKK